MKIQLDNQYVKMKHYVDALRADHAKHISALQKHIGRLEIRIPPQPLFILGDSAAARKRERKRERVRSAALPPYVPIVPVASIAPRPSRVQAAAAAAAAASAAAAARI